MKILFRVDASSRVGMGHLVRSMCLARTLADLGARVDVMVSRPSPAVSARVEGAGASLVALDVDPGSADDLDRTFDRAKGSDVVVVDGYTFDAEYMYRLARTTVPTVRIDDGGGAAGDLIVNGNLYAESLDYPGSSLCLLGPRWALLDARFAQARAMERAPAGPEPRLVVTMGGADPTRETEKVLRALELLPPWPCTVVAGALCEHKDDIARAVDARRGPTTLAVDVDDMARLLAAHDVAIAASGTAALELACLGIPAALVAVADNQRRVLDTAASLGTADALGWHADVDPARIARVVGALARSEERRTAMASRGRALVDGRGAARVASKIVHLGRLRRAS